MLLGLHLLLGYLRLLLNLLLLLNLHLLLLLLLHLLLLHLLLLHLLLPMLLHLLLHLLLHCRALAEYEMLRCALGLLHRLIQTRRHQMLRDVVALEVGLRMPLDSRSQLLLTLLDISLQLLSGNDAGPLRGVDTRACLHVLNLSVRLSRPFHFTAHLDSLALPRLLADDWVCANR